MKAFRRSKALSGRLSRRLDTESVQSRRVQIYSARVTSSKPQNTVEIQPIVYTKTESSRTFLLEALSQHYLFASLSTQDLNRMIDCMQPQPVVIDEIITSQGEFGKTFYCIEKGDVKILVNGQLVSSYGPGDCFGELALIYNTARAASVIATSPGLLWVLDLWYVI